MVEVAVFIERKTIQIIVDRSLGLQSGGGGGGGGGNQDIADVLTVGNQLDPNQTILGDGTQQIVDFAPATLPTHFVQLQQLINAERFFLAQSVSVFPTTGLTTMLYVEDNGSEANIYYWTGFEYKKIGLILGDSFNTAHRGDHGSTAYAHSQASGNVHGTTLLEIISAGNLIGSAEIRSTSTGVGSFRFEADDEPSMQSNGAVNSVTAKAYGVDIKGTTLVDITAPTINLTGNVFGLSKSVVGLGNVNNTSDLDKPISTAQAAVNQTKENIITPSNLNYEFFNGNKQFISPNSLDIHRRVNRGFTDFLFGSGANNTPVGENGYLIGTFSGTGAGINYLSIAPGSTNGSNDTCVSFNTGTTATGVSVARTSATAGGFYMPGSSIQIGFRWRIGALSTAGTQEATHRFGFWAGNNISIGTPPQSGFYFQVAPDNILRCVVNVGGINQNTASYGVVTTTFSTYEIKAIANFSNITTIEFYRDGVLLYSHTGTFPANGQYGVLIGVIKTVGTTAITSNHDHYWFNHFLSYDKF